MIRLRGYTPGEFGRTNVAFFGSGDGWQISRVQPLSRQTPVFVELDFGHGRDEREERGTKMGRLGGRSWFGVLTVSSSCQTLYQSLSITPQVLAGTTLRGVSCIAVHLSSDTNPRLMWGNPRPLESDIPANRKMRIEGELMGSQET